MSKQPMVAVDFDGVLHSYTTPWINAHTIPDPPVEGAIEWLYGLATAGKFKIVILSTRCKTWRGRRAIHRWIFEQFLEYQDYQSPNWAHDVMRAIKCSYKKLPAWVYIDDRAWRFTGENFPSTKEIRAAMPWNHAMRHKKT